MKLALALTAGTAAAFVAPSSATAVKTQLAAAPDQEWAGATAPFGFFDPLGLSKDVDAGRLAFYRECESMRHFLLRLPRYREAGSNGRVAMLASSASFQEHYTFTGIDSPSYVSFEQPGLAGGLWLGLAVMLGNFEGKSSRSCSSTAASSRSRTSPTLPHKGGPPPGRPRLRPARPQPRTTRTSSPHDRRSQQRPLAMIGIAGMVAQELGNASSPTTTKVRL